ncbi:hypothetical protein C7B65_23940 [Phormidesmis priestleyi ULC007]|uniref:O-antigen ligase domain-containing protein n=1 Tax=Phormidesmis priestleyi ULC007 TaxID=1920490 RepID=A0A2T1D5C7_9CYAN|nr:hypothetical protein [Phormidesmis priestleyi]PSB15651.1 hypothetical protein C7B65_23940 [Phormidesmis priestleyi ULC007]
MSSQVVVYKKKKGIVRSSTLILIGFATAFFPRLLTYFGGPPPINFVHFGVVPIVVVIALLQTRVKNRQQIAIAWELIVGLGILLTCMTASALINDAGFLNIFLQFMLNGEPFLLLIAIVALPLAGENLKRFRSWIVGFCLFNLILAIAQSILLPVGLYPGAQGGQLITDNIAGVFASKGGSAGNYISCTVSLYFALYFFNVFKTVPLWKRIALLIAAFYQTSVSDSKQIFVAFFAGWLLVVLTNVKKPAKILMYIIPLILIVCLFYWALAYTDWEPLEPYRNFTTGRAEQNLYGPDGEATILKTSAFRVIPAYYTTPLNWLFGLGPGHTATRLGGWILRDYKALLLPLGATIHPASEAFWQIILGPAGWLSRESTMYFPMFTWVGIWGDLGLVGLAAYLYLSSIVWRRICVDDFCKFLLLSTAVLGFIITQMEEPGQMLTIACFLGLRWHEEREAKNTLHDDLSPPPLLSVHSQHW